MVKEEAQASVWNFDGAELYLIFELKATVHEHLTNWNLEDCYWALRKLRMELDAKLRDGEGKNTEKKTVDIYIDDLENERTIFNSKEITNETAGKFYLVLETFYMYLCKLMKTHKLYFREGDDPSLAILRR